MNITDAKVGMRVRYMGRQAGEIIRVHGERRQITVRFDDGFTMTSLPFKFEPSKPEPPRDYLAEALLIASGKSTIPPCREHIIALIEAGEERKRG